MTPLAIIRDAAAEGVTLTLTPVGTIKATGKGAAVNRWIPVIREHKTGILAALQEVANDDTLPDSAMEARRQRVLSVLAERPDVRYAVVVDNPNADPVIVALGIRDQATCELCIPRATFDPFLLLALIERRGGSVH